MGAAFFVSASFLLRQYNLVLYTVVALQACYISLASTGEQGALAVTWGDRRNIAGLTLAMIGTIIVAVRVLASWGGA